MGGVGDTAAGFDRLRCRHCVSLVFESARTNAEGAACVLSYLTHYGATHSVRSPPPCGEGLGVGVVRFFAGVATEISPYHPLPIPPPHNGGGSRPSLPV